MLHLFGNRAGEPKTADDGIDLDINTGSGIAIAKCCTPWNGDIDIVDRRCRDVGVEGDRGMVIAAHRYVCSKVVRVDVRISSGMLLDGPIARVLRRRRGQIAGTEGLVGVGDSRTEGTCPSDLIGGTILTVRKQLNTAQTCTRSNPCGDVHVVSRHLPCAICEDEVLYAEIRIGRERTRICASFIASSGWVSVGQAKKGVVRRRGESGRKLDH